LESAAPVSTSPAAERGVHLHAIMAEMVETGKSVALERGYLSTEDAAAVEWCYAQIEPMIRDAAGALVLSEYRLDLSTMGIEPTDPERGRVDLAIVYPGQKAILVDYKFGRGYVPHPRWSWQFRAYASGLWVNFGGDTVQAIKLQPAMDEAGQRQEYTFSESELRAGTAAVKAIVEAAQAEDAPLVPGTKQCQWCAARQTCPARSGALATIPRHLSIKDHMEIISPAERAEFFEKLLVAQDWVEDAVEACQSLALDSGMQFPGWTIGEGRKSRAWKDPIAALPTLRSVAVDAGKDPEQLVETSVVTVAQAEKILGKKTFAGLDGLVEVKAGAPKLVREK
jgi:hypothetical protein